VKMKKIMDEKIPEFNRMVEEKKIPAVNLKNGSMRNPNRALRDESSTQTKKIIVQ